MKTSKTYKNFKKLRKLQLQDLAVLRPSSHGLRRASLGHKVDPFQAQTVHPVYQAKIPMSVLWRWPIEVSAAYRQVLLARQVSDRSERDLDSESDDE